MKKISKKLEKDRTKRQEDEKVKPTGDGSGSSKNINN
jgi:hypothetical protein